MGSTFPPCYGTLAAFEVFEQDERAMDVRPPGFSYCHACSPAFQAEMLKRHACMHPETVFVTVVDEDGEEHMAGLRQAAPVVY